MYVNRVLFAAMICAMGAMECSLDDFGISYLNKPKAYSVGLNFKVLSSASAQHITV